MQASNIPSYKIPTPFASGNLSNATVPIPTAAQPNGFASWVEGWGIVNATNPGAGGIPPRWQDFLGLFYICSAWLQWVQAGGAPIGYDSAFQTTIGGYPNGALVASATTAGLYWRSTVDNNTTNPDTGGANWVAEIPSFSAIGSHLYNAAGTFTFTIPSPILLVEGWGAGGGGSGNAANQAGACGGGGSYGLAILTGLVVGNTITATIGAAGAAGTAGGNNGGNGGTTSFGSYLSCPAGAGGIANSGNIALGGGPPSGSALILGIEGGNTPGCGFILSTPVGIGGSSPRGGPGGPTTVGGGTGGQWPGGGGGSGMNTTSPQPGGAGAAGGLIIRW